MDYSNEERQRKFRDQMKETGKKQRTFFLSDAAMDTLKKRKAETEASSLNHALESLLTTTQPSAKMPEVETKTVTIYEPTAEQKAIIEQARIVADAFRCWEQSPGNEQGKTLGSEAKKLADLI